MKTKIWIGLVGLVLVLSAASALAAVNVVVDGSGNFDVTAASDSFTTWAVNNGGVATNFTTLMDPNSGQIFSTTPNCSTYGAYNDQEGMLTVPFTFNQPVKSAKLHVCSLASDEYSENSARNIVYVIIDGVKTRIYQHDAPARWPAWGVADPYIFGTLAVPTAGVYEYDVDITPLVYGKTSFQLAYDVVAGYSGWRYNGGAFYKVGNGPFHLYGTAGTVTSNIVSADSSGNFSITAPSNSFTAWAIARGASATNFATIIDSNTGQTLSTTPNPSTYGVWTDQQGMLTVPFNFSSPVKTAKLHVCSLASDEYSGNSARNVVQVIVDGVPIRIYQHDAPERWLDWGGTDQYIFGTLTCPTPGIFECDVDITPLVYGKTSFQLEYDVVAGFSGWRYNGGAFYMVGNGAFSLSGTLGTEPWVTAVTRGQRILVQRGLQLEALCSPFINFSNEQVTLHLSRILTEGNFTAAFFNSKNISVTSISLLGIDPGVLWGRITDAENKDTEYLLPWELSYLPNLVKLQYKDEQDMTASDNINAAGTWFNEIHSRYPNVLAYTNQACVPSSGAGLYTVDQLKNYVTTAHPDILMFDFYPFIGDLTGGSPTTYYTLLSRFRQAALAGLDGNGNQPIPYGLWLQAFVDEGNSGHHHISESEIRLNQFLGWAFGYKLADTFIYNDQDGYYINSVMFDSSDDSTPNSTFYQMAETNRQSRILGPSLVRLLSTDVRMVMGKHYVSRSWFEKYILGKAEWDYNTTPSGITTGISNVTGSYITGISCGNLGSYNNGLRGDLIVGFFKPLHESFDGTAYSNQGYFMIVNGLNDSVGTAANCRQSITVDFNFGTSGITGLQRLRRSDGEVETISSGGSYSGLTFTSLGNNRYRMVLTLDGGTGDLFKYNTGAPFVGSSGAL